MPQAGGVAVDTDIRGRGGFSLLLGEWRKTLGIFESGDSASRRVAVVAITTVTSGVAYKGARLKAKENRLVDKGEAREAYLALERKRDCQS